MISLGTEAVRGTVSLIRRPGNRDGHGKSDKEEVTAWTGRQAIDDYNPERAKLSRPASSLLNFAVD